MLLKIAAVSTPELINPSKFPRPGLIDRSPKAS